MSRISDMRMRQIEAEMSRFEKELLESTPVGSSVLPPPPPPPGPPPMFLPPQLRSRLTAGIRLPQGPPVVVPPPIRPHTVQTAAAAAKSAAAATNPPPMMDDNPPLSKMIYSAPPQLLKPPSPPPPPPAPVITKNLLRSVDKIKKKRKKDEIAIAMGATPGASTSADTGEGIVMEQEVKSLPPPPAPPKRPVNPPGTKKKRFIRTAASTMWEDPSLAEWDSDDFRIFAGDLGNEVSDEVLQRAFSKYPSFLRSKVVRDRRTGKTRGYGFVSFKDPSDFMRAMREMQGKYVGNRPIKLRKSSWKDRQIEVVRKKDKEKKKLGLKV